MRDRGRAAGLGHAAAQGADDRRRLQDPAERVRRHLDLEDPLPRGPEAAHAAAHGRRLPPLQPVRRRAPAHDPAPAARRVPAPAGDPPGARRGPRHRPRRRPADRRQPVRRAILVNTSTAYLTLDEVIEETGAREELVRELEDFGVIQPERRDGNDGLRRDRPRDRPRRQRALALRGRGAQPARLPLLRRPRGEPARGAARRRRCARATRSGARRRWRASRTSPRPSATSSTCCWSATCAASPARRLRRRHVPCPRSPAAGRSTPRRRSLGARLRPLQPAALVAAHEPGRERRADQGRQAQPVDEGPGDRARDAACAPTTAASARPRTSATSGSSSSRTRPSSKHLRSSVTEIGLRPADGGTEVPLTARQTLRGLSRLGSPMMRRGPAADARRGAGGDRARPGGPEGERMSAAAAPRLEVVGLGRPGDRRRARPRVAGAAARGARRPAAMGAAGVGRGGRRCRPRRAAPGRDRRRRSARSTCSSGHEDRVRHAAGKGYADLAGCRSGSLEAAPDAVVLPGDGGEVGRGARGLRRRGRRGRAVRRRHQRRRRRRAPARRARAPDQPRPGAAAGRRGRPDAR